MVKSTIISAHKANNLFWLGRYEERVYITLHQLSKCCDKMIDGERNDYLPIWQKLDTQGNYQTNDEFTVGMMYDETNPSSIMSAQTRAMDNAILLREEIMSETLGYLEMSVALLQSATSDRLVARLLGRGRTASAQPRGSLHHDDGTQRGEPGHAAAVRLRP